MIVVQIFIKVWNYTRSECNSLRSKLIQSSPLLNSDNWPTSVVVLVVAVVEEDHFYLCASEIDAIKAKHIIQMCQSVSEQL